MKVQLGPPRLWRATRTETVLLGTEPIQLPDAFRGTKSDPLKGSSNFRLCSMNYVAFESTSYLVGRTDGIPRHLQADGLGGF